MRKIKFRAWDRKHLRMRKALIVDNWNDHVKLFNEERARLYWRDVRDVKLMQYTGLKDVEGIEIYEGDVVEACCGVERYGVWEYTERCFIEDIRAIPLAVYEACETIVIGNIYESPELLAVSNVKQAQDALRNGEKNNEL